MTLIRIQPKYAVAKGVMIEGYITKATHNMLQISGLSLADLVKVRDYQCMKHIANNACVIDLNKHDYSIVED